MPAQASGIRRTHHTADTDLVATRVLIALLGLALIGVAFAACRGVSPTVGEPFFDSHPRLKTSQRLFTPIAMALVGVGVLVAALAQILCTVSLSVVVNADHETISEVADRRQWILNVRENPKQAMEADLSVAVVGLVVVFMGGLISVAGVHPRWQSVNNNSPAPVLGALIVFTMNKGVSG